MVFRSQFSLLYFFSFLSFILPTASSIRLSWSLCVSNTAVNKANFSSRHLTLFSILSSFDFSFGCSSLFGTVMNHLPDFMSYEMPFPFSPTSWKSLGMQGKIVSTCIARLIVSTWECKLEAAFYTTIGHNYLNWLIPTVLEGPHKEIMINNTTHM